MPLIYYLDLLALEIQYKPYRNLRKDYQLMLETKYVISSCMTGEEDFTIDIMEYTERYSQLEYL